MPTPERHPDRVRHEMMAIGNFTALLEGVHDSAHRLEKKNGDTKDTTRIGDELSAVLDVFDHDLEAVIADLMQNRLRFNMFVRLFFSVLVVELDRPGVGWRKGKKKGELPECNPRIVKFALQEKFALFVDQSQLELPEALKKAQRYDENLSESQGSPSQYIRTDLSLQFLDSLHVFLSSEGYYRYPLQDATNHAIEVG